LLYTTLHLVAIPLRQNIVSGNTVTVPLALLNWSVLDQNLGYQPTIQNLTLNGGWVEFEYRPWSEFQEMAVTGLAVALEQPANNASQRLPEVRLWDWAAAQWVTLADISWGQTAVADPAAFLGPNNTVRIRLQDKDSQDSREIKAVYPVLRGETH
jgi:hypothetical protein